MPSRLHLGLIGVIFFLLALFLATPTGTNLRHRILPSSTSQRKASSASPTTPPTKSERPPTRPRANIEATKRLLRETILSEVRFENPALEDCPAILTAILAKAGLPKADLRFQLRPSLGGEAEIPAPIGPDMIELRDISPQEILSFLSETVPLKYIVPPTPPPQPDNNSTQ